LSHSELTQNQRSVRVLRRFANAIALLKAEFQSFKLSRSQTYGAVRP